MILKYRAWLKKEKRMVEVAVINYTESWIEYADKDDPMWRCRSFFDEIVLMYSTDFQDCNNKDIYFDDIVRLDFDDFYAIGRIEKSSNGLAVFKDIFTGKTFDVYNWDYKCTIIGSFWEHPHLLEQ